MPALTASAAGPSAPTRLTPTAQASQDVRIAKGTVTAKTFLAERSAPSLWAPLSGKRYSKGTHLTINCSIWGTPVGGDHIWYKLENRNGWVSARYVHVVGLPTFPCLDKSRLPANGTDVTSVTIRQGPSTKDRSLGIIPQGPQRYYLWCKVINEDVGGNRLWYWHFQSAALTSLASSPPATSGTPRTSRSADQGQSAVRLSTSRPLDGHT